MVFIARFLASMMMHIYCEQDLRLGLNMMKYVVNHHRNFVNPYASFVFGFMLFSISLWIEINGMIVFQTMVNVMDIIMRYFSIATILRIPRFYYSTCLNNKMLICKGLKLPITNIRADNPRKGAHWTIHGLRVVHKICRYIFCCFGYYFTPFLTIFLNMKFMVSGIN